MKRRGGFTIVEVVVSAAVFATVVGGLFMAFGGGHRSADAARATGAVSGAVLLSERILEDVRQIGYDPGSTTDLVVGPNQLTFHITHFAGTETRLRKVSYSAERRPNGVLALHRRAESKELGPLELETFDHVPLVGLSFSLSTDTRFGGRSVRVSLTVRADERPDAGPSARDYTHELLARLPQAPAWGDPARDPARRVRTSGHPLHDQ